MPFKSEAQRRYLWANEPEIARDWADTYGSRIQKKNGGITQAGAINYEPSDMVSVPKEFRARAHSPNTHLAYITDDEAGILQALKPDTPHKGPRGIPNYDSFDAAGAYSNPDTGYSASSGGAGGGWQDSSKQDEKIRQKWEQASDQQKQTWDPASEQRKLKYGLTDDDEKKDIVPEDKKTKKGSWLENINKKSRDKRTAYYQKRALDKIRNKLKLDGVDISGINSLADIQAWYNDQMSKAGGTQADIAATFRDLGYKDPASFDKYNHEMWNKLTGETGYIPTSPSSFKHPLLDKIGAYKKGLSLDEIQRDIDRANFIGTEKDLAMNWVDRMKLHSPQQYASYMGGMNYNPRTGEFTERGGGDDYGGVPGAVPLGDMPAWQQQGFNSYEDWLATQGGGTTGGGTGGTTTTQLANTGWPYKDYGTKDYQTSNTFMDLAYPGGSSFLLASGGRVPAAFGGIMDTETGRRGYFLGSIKKAVKGVAKAAGKVLKSDVGKLAVLGLGAYGANAGWFGKGMSGWVGGLKSMAQDKKWLGNLLLDKAGTGFSPWKLAGIGMTAAPFLGIGTKAKQDASIVADRGGRLINPLTQEEDTPQGIRTSLNTAIEEAGNDPVKLSAINDAFPFLNLGTHLPYPTYGVKDGGRIGFKRGSKGKGSTTESTWDTDKMKKDLGIALDFTLPSAIGNITKGIAGIAKTNQTEIMNVIKKLVAATPAGQIGEVVNLIVDRYKIDPELVQKMVISQMTDANIGFEPPGELTADEGYRPIGIDAGAEDPWDIPQQPRKRYPDARDWLDKIKDLDWSKVKPVPMPGSEPIPLHPDATTLNPHQDINPIQTMEFRDANQDGIEDRSQGIYKDRDIIPWDPSRKKKYLAYGGRIRAQEGGLMDLGGMEKDYRNNGGFVAIGGEERADDVPARLSRNEFVFTADAVRGAGGGDIDKGAEIMENVMKNLEQGGQISEETQGNTGAQEMFSVSERIGEVL